MDSDRELILWKLLHTKQRFKILSRRIEGPDFSLIDACARRTLETNRLAHNIASADIGWIVAIGVELK